ncbi:hypothetical protein DE146DRAFT_663891 [Phaeosphaeria sp. MPI-PUGE-AT-0046c]|nr:hypothetical protein DE146DRAFT_663891 [Phaeosphaeria sp. MPI-PUGE-AT-0046c]
MHISSTAKIIFFLISHCVAAYTPPRAIIPPPRVHQAPAAGNLQILNPKIHSSSNDGIELAPRQDIDAGSCDRRAKCKKKKIRHPNDSAKCIRCPPLTKADPTSSICIKDEDLSKDDKKKQYEEKIKEKIKEKFDQFKEKIKERLEKKKEAKNKEWEEKDKQRQDKRNQKKFRRMAVCTPAVAAAIGTAAMLELADGGFSEDLFDSINGDTLEFWPSNDIDNDWLDQKLPEDESDIINEDYIQNFLEVGDAASGNAKRSNENRVTQSSDDASPSTGKRNIISDIANAFRALARIIVKAATKRAGGGGAVNRATKFFSDGRKPNLKKPGESKFSRAEQKEKAKEISQNKNWNKCLRGEKPEK